MDITQYLNALKNWFLTTGLKVIFVVLITGVMVIVVKTICSRLASMLIKGQEDEEAKKRAKTISSVLKSILTVIILVIASMMVLGQLGIEIGPLLATAGIVGIALGFAGQSLVKDILHGFFIILWDQIRVGDVVEIAGKSGLVEKLNLKMTVIRDLSGNVHFVPNGTIDVVTNMTKDYSRHLLDIGVAYREDVDEVIQVIKDVDGRLQNDPDFQDDILEPVEIFGLDEFAESAVVVRARIKTRPGKQWRVGREFKRRLKKMFDEKNIEIPFPHTTLYLGLDKKGSAPPLRIRVEKDDKAALS